jgi:membrane protease YdiL (CAAX protease family)
MAIVAGIDVGTQSTKVVCYDTQTKTILASASAPHELISRGDGSREQEAVWWTDAITACFNEIDPKIRDMLLRPNFRGNIKLYLLIYFGPSLLIIVSALLYFLILPGHFDPALTYLQGAEVSPSTIIMVSLLQVLIVGPVINIIPTMGEELGWRGYLLPKLRTLFSDRLSLVLSGVIWGLWHAPVIILGHNYGTNYLGYPYLGILMMLLFCVSMGIIVGYFTIKINSVIPAAMVHSAINAGAALPLLVAKVGINQIIGPTITGLIGGLPFMVVAVILFVRQK